jgi:phosphoribosyl-ATP pyrophosphohydrolase/phosphoribosyl-AMP cyclohydrolase
VGGIEDVRYDAQGLIPAVAQDAETGEVLMAASMNAEALRLTLATRTAHYYSRSRGRLWKKGEASGHTQAVAEVLYDCDGDALLLKVHQTGVACHTGNRSCFFRRLAAPAGPGAAGAAGPGAGVVRRVYDTLASRKVDPPPGSYVAALLAGGTDRILKKIGEEATEVVLAAKAGRPEGVVFEVADVWFHTLVLLAHQGIDVGEVFRELARREGAPRRGEGPPGG